MARKRILLYLLIIYHGLIFYLSSLPGKDVGNWLVFPDYIAHFIEYAGLGFLWFLFQEKKDNNRVSGKYFYPVLFSLIFGITDEIHQLYVPGRTFSGLDLLADGCGAVIGVLAGRLFILLFPGLTGAKKDAQADDD